MKLTDDQQKWIKMHAEILESIFQPDLNQMKEDVFNMEPGKERNIKIEFINKYQKTLKLIGFIRDSKEQEPESGI